MVLDVDSICSGVHLHFIMMEKSALAGEGGGARPTLFISTLYVLCGMDDHSGCHAPRYGQLWYLASLEIWTTMVLVEPRGMENYGT